jgi:glucose/arabinose dehydrogenase
MKTIRLIIIAALSVGVLLLAKKFIVGSLFSPTESPIPTGISYMDESAIQETPSTIPKEDIEVVAENLKIPWELAFLPGGEMLVTERPGNLLRIGKDKKVIKIDGVNHLGEGGLLGLALHPKYEENNQIYLYFTSRENGNLINRVERYKLNGDKLTEKKEILSGIPASSNHDGGRIKFGPDGYLYITTGDAENPASAQDKNALSGKILRIDTEGAKAPDNPYGNLTYSYGHRNSQGIVWDDKGNLWATEHGPSGGQTGNDEINLIKKGLNYGWPDIKGVSKKSGMESPIAESGTKDTWAPGGMVFYGGSLFFAGLRGEALYQAKIISENNLALSAHFKSDFGRLRTVIIGPDGYFYILTNNTDGRGDPNSGDDRIIKFNPEVFTN